MGPSPTLVAPGLRTAARTGWRGGVATAVHVVATQPSLWLLGALGYLLRGGAIVVTLAILVLPSPVSVRLMLGGYLGSFGLTPQFWLAAGIGLALLAVIVLLALVVTAALEIAAFERFVAAEQARSVVHRDARRPSGPARRRLLGALVLVQLAGVVVLLVAALPMVMTAVQATYEELMRPSMGGGMLYDRVLARMAEPLFGWLVALVAVEMVGAVASRRLLARGFGLRPELDGRAARSRSTIAATSMALGAGLARPIMRPLTTLPTAFVGWLAMLAVLVPLGWGLALAWQAVRAQFLRDFEAAALSEMLVAAALLSLTFLAGVALAGFASAVRCGLWTSEELR
jgi:hypothetical protein